MSNHVQSARAQIIERRTYNRPLDQDGKVFETSEQAWTRVIGHQRWLWERAKGEKLDKGEEGELTALKELFESHKCTMSGRTRWLGGTDIAKKVEITQFNCSATELKNVDNVVDMFWLLLNGSGVGFVPTSGELVGFPKKLVVEQIYSKKIIDRDSGGHPVSSPSLKGRSNNVETFTNGVWTLSIGDSAKAWAKAAGKLMREIPENTHTLVIDTSEIRPLGFRLSQYGWVSSGDRQLQKAFKAIAEIRNKRFDSSLLTKIDLLDVGNWFGTTLASRRSAEICLMDYDSPEWEEFTMAKKNYWEGNEQREQSNNSLVFNAKPSRAELDNIFTLMAEAGGSEPGFINGEAMKNRSGGYAEALNPCAEILLPKSPQAVEEAFGLETTDTNGGGVCNLAETYLSRFNGRFDELLLAHHLVARANYRQTLVDFNDGILSSGWDNNNRELHLCGVGVSAVVGWEYFMDAERIKELADAAREGAHSMADDLGTKRAVLVTTLKPAGTQTKASGRVGDELCEGLHRPLSKYLFNWVNFQKDDPIVRACRAAGYETMPKPFDDTGVLIKFPVEYHGVDFTTATLSMHGKQVEVEVNIESAISQLERYKMWQVNYTDHNSSVTISYSPDEVPSIVGWLLENWDIYIGVSFLYRTDPTMTAKDLGYKYLPQEPVDKDTYFEYANSLWPVDLSGTDQEGLLDTGECSTGACPIR